MKGYHCIKCFNAMNQPTKAPSNIKRPQCGRERLIELDGQHYWLQSDGSIRATDWILRGGCAVLTSKTNQ